MTHQNYISQITDWVTLNCDPNKPLMWTLYKGQEAKASAPVSSVQTTDISYSDSLRQLIEMCRIIAVTQSYCTITCKSALNAVGNTCTFMLTNQPTAVAGVYGMGVAQSDSRYEEERNKREKLEKELSELKLHVDFEKRFQELEDKYREKPSTLDKVLENPTIMGILGPIIEKIIMPASVGVAGIGEEMTEKRNVNTPTENAQIAIDYNAVMTVCHILVSQGYNTPHNQLLMCANNPDEFKMFLESVNAKQYAN